MFGAMLMQTFMSLLHSFLFDSQLLDSYLYLEVLGRINTLVTKKIANDFKQILEEMVLHCLFILYRY